MPPPSSASPAIAVKEAVHKIQLSLLEGISSETLLVAAGSLLSKSDYQDVVTERSIGQLCGYPLCPNSLSSTTEPGKKGRYRISLKEHKVYDLSETRMYCSTKCVVDSQVYAGSLQDERCLTADTAKIDKLVRLFEGSSTNDKEGLGETGDLGLSRLKIQEKENVKSDGGEVVPLEEWVGPSNAIEGYVPQHERKPKNRKHRKAGGPSSDDSELKSGVKDMFNEMDFVSCIIMQDNEYGISKKPPQRTQKSTDAKLKNSTKEVNHLVDNDQLKLSTASSTNAQNKSEIKLKGLNERKSVTVSSYKGMPQETSSGTCQGDIGENHRENVKESGGGIETQSTVLKSSLKSSGTTRANHSVTWADEKSDGACNRALCEFSEMENKKEPTKVFGTADMNNGDSDDTLRFASAEACAQALSQAAEAVALGEADVPDAVSDAGLIILPPPLDDNVVRSEEVVEAVDPEPAPLKWPKRTGISESDFFNSEDSWYDSPPEGFSLDLSPFATMFMHLFAWISSSSLAYIYGRDDSVHEDYASINGREYPRKIVLTDGRSSEIKQTLASCLAQALPELVSDLRLPTPISTIESRMGHLLETMSFCDPLPPFRKRQWKLFALLFIDALSVCRIPALASHMTNRRRFFQKVLDAAQINVEEYELMKDLVIPLGRAPQLATQSGG